MPKFEVDYQMVSDTVEKTKYKLSEVKHKIEKVAFDVVRFVDDDMQRLWQVQSSDDGEYIISLYEDNDNVKISQASVNNWEVVVSGNNVNVFYKKYPVMKLASSQLGVPAEEVSLVKKYLPEKLANDKSFTTSLLKNMSEVARQDIIKRYPELA